MQLINNEIIIKKNEINNYLNSILYFENQPCFNIESATNDFPGINLTALKTSMKASVILMLYNVVESTITKCLIKIHDSIKQSNLCYSKLNPCIQKIIWIYYENAINKSNDSHSAVNYKMEQFNLLKSFITFLPFFNFNVSN